MGIHKRGIWPNGCSPFRNAFVHMENCMTIFSRTLATAGLIGLLCSAAHAETLRLSTLKNPGSPGELAAQELAKQVEARTEGRVTIKIYPSDQLGDYTEVYEQLMQGVVDMAIQPVPALDDKRVAITWFPYAFTNYASAEEMHKPGGAVFDIINAATSERNVAVLGVYGEGMGGAGFAKDVTDAGNPDAKKHDLKVRVWPGGATHQALLERLGYSTGTLPWAELYTGMQTCIVDGQVGGTAAMALESFKDITKTWVQFNDHFGELVPDRARQPCQAFGRGSEDPARGRAGHLHQALGRGQGG